MKSKFEPLESRSIHDGVQLKQRIMKKMMHSLVTSANNA